MIKYKTTNIFNTLYARIEKIEVERETEKSVWIKGNKCCKTSYCCYFDTWQEAHEYILDLANNQVNRAILQLERTKSLLVNIYGLKEEL